MAVQCMIMPGGAFQKKPLSVVRRDDCAASSSFRPERVSATDQALYLEWPSNEDGSALVWQL